MDDDLSRFCCLNPDCADHGRRGLGNLSVCMRYGRDKQRRMLYCKTCKDRFSERKGTPLFDARLPEEKAIALLQHVAEGCGVRKTSRLVGVSKDTVARYSARAGEHARRMHEELVALSPGTREVQFDEKWSFVGKKEKHCAPDDPADAERGDHWDHVALDPEHRLVVGVVPGKRTAQNVAELVQDFRRRTEGRLMNVMTSDEYPAYETAILEAYGEEVRPERTGRRGRPRKPYKAPPPNLNYATVHKTRKKGRVTKIDFRAVFGTLAAVTAALAQSTVSRTSSGSMESNTPNSLWNFPRNLHTAASKTAPVASENNTPIRASGENRRPASGRPAGDRRPGVGHRDRRAVEQLHVPPPPQPIRQCRRLQP